MFSAKYKTLLFTLILSLFSGLAIMAQTGDTPIQRLEIARQKVETMRRSLSSAASSVKEDNKEDKSKKEDKDNPETPLGRLTALEKETSTLQADINNLRGRVDRSEKYEFKDIEQLEERVGEMQKRVDTALTETASARANPASAVGTPREIKKKKVKILGITVGSKTDEYEELLGSVTPGRDKELFVVATREVRKKNYDVGRLLFQTIVTTYPDSPYLPMAKLAIADSFYLEGSTSGLVQAVGSYQDWLAFFPTHPLSERVLLKVAEAEMRQIGLPDREITHSRRAEQRLKAILQQYPNTVLLPEVKTRLDEVQDNLALHDLDVANYYYKQAVDFQKGGLKGAQSRLREILDKYPNFSFMDEALYKLAVTYLIEEETDQAARYFQQIVSDYPNSEYIDKSKEQLNLIGAKIPEVNPARTNVLPPEKASFFANFKNQLFGVYPLTIDKNGVLMTRDFDEKKFELIDQIVENGGDLQASQIPKALTTVIKDQTAPKQQK